MVDQQKLDDEESRNGGVIHHILPVSATMVGVCMTVIGLMQLLPKGGQWLDDVIAFDSLIFITSALLSYTSIRTKRNTAQLERWADMVFVAGLVMMVVINFLIAFDLLKH
jgi:hypothetical protein